jgi:hypothetical protein
MDFQGRTRLSGEFALPLAVLAACDFRYIRLQGTEGTGRALKVLSLGRSGDDDL